MRRLGAVAAVFLAGLLAPAEAPARPEARPNVVLILADDFGYECVGANGGTSYRTPNLDRLAAEGARFTHCYSQPLCTPTRVQLMTGQYNHRNYTAFARMEPEEHTFGRMFKQAGYATGLAQKWQLGPKKPDHFGFDEYAIHSPAKGYWGMNVLRNGEEIQLAPDAYGPEYFCDFLLDFVRRHKDRPFLAYFPVWLTHAPFQPTPDSGPADRSGSDARFFPDMVAYLDKLVGRIVGDLENLGLRERTLVLFTGDNGTPGNIVSSIDGREVKGGKGKLTDSGTHVPLIACWPGTIPAGTVSHDLVDMTDFVPTLREAIGGDWPADRPLDGRNFLPRLLGRPGAPRPWIYASSDPKKSEDAEDGGHYRLNAFVRDRRWKLYEDGRLFDMASDPEEKEPIPAEGVSEEARDARARLGKALEGFPRVGRGVTERDRHRKPGS